MNESAICPTCGGRGKTMALVNDGYHCVWRPWPCRDCGGTRMVDADFARRMAEADERRRARLLAGESLHDAATRHGMSVVAYSAWGHGRGPGPEDEG